MSDETRRLLNGEPADSLPLSDRGLAYGDGLFETLLVRSGRPCLWQQHLRRMRQGAAVLAIPFPDEEAWLADVSKALQAGQQGVLKLCLTRGSGPRGYAPPAQPVPSRIVEFSGAGDSQWPQSPAQGVALIHCRTPLSENPRLAGIKHLNRLDQVLAAAEVRAAGAFEGLMRNANGELICGTRCNLLIRAEDAWITPSVERCGIAGVVRGEAIALAGKLSEPLRIAAVDPADLDRARAVFLTNSLIGVVAVHRIGEREFDPEPPHWGLPAALRERVLHA